MPPGFSRVRALEFSVAQVSNLLYRRLPACRLWNLLARGRSRAVADWKSATQQVRKPALPGRVLGTVLGTEDGRAPAAKGRPKHRLEIQITAFETQWALRYSFCR